MEIQQEEGEELAAELEVGEVYDEEEADNSDEGRVVPVEVDKDGEIVGLRSSDNGRSCEVHPVCGASLAANDLIRFRSCVVTINDIPSNAIKAVKIKDGTEGCVVGFLPRQLVARPALANRLTNKFAQVIDLYEGSDNSLIDHPAINALPNGHIG